MNSLDRLIRQHSRLLSAVALVGALSLLGLDAIYILHHVAEEACPAQESGDPFDCYTCTTLLRIGLDLPILAMCQAPQPGEILPLPDALSVPVTTILQAAAARAPPAVIL